MYLSGHVRPDMPAMLQPGMGNKPQPGQPWAADTGCYGKPEAYSDERYLAWLERLAGDRDRCLFATAPDAFGDAARTLELSLPMLPRIRAAGYRAALVAQPHLELEQVPWDELDCLFLGGPDWWQHSPQAAALMREAKARGKWLHVGRVNGQARMVIAHALEADSVDGTFLAFGPERNLPRLNRWLAELTAAGPATGNLWD